MNALRFIFSAILLVMLLRWCGVMDTWHQENLSAAKAPLVPVTKPEKSAEEKADDAAMMMAIIGARQLKNSMRDPSSFKLESVLLIDKTHAICYEYRAHNGFGGVNVGRAVWKGDRTKFLTAEQSGFVTLWNRECGKKQGSERVSTVLALM